MGKNKNNMGVQLYKSFCCFWFFFLVVTIIAFWKNCDFLNNISAGMLTGFMFFFLGGLKNYDLAYYEEKMRYIDDTIDQFDQIQKKLESIFRNSEPLDYVIVNEMDWQLMIISAKICNIFSDERKQNNTVEMFAKRIQEEHDKIIQYNVNDWTNELAEDIRGSLISIYKNGYMIQPLLCGVKYDTVIIIHRLKGMIY